MLQQEQDHLEESLLAQVDRSPESLGAALLQYCSHLLRDDEVESALCSGQVYVTAAEYNANPDKEVFYRNENASDMVKRFLDDGANPHCTDENGDTAIMHLVTKGILPPLFYFNGRVGFDVNQQNNWGETALHLACILGDNSAINTLLSMGANPLIINNNGRSPYSLLVKPKGRESFYKEIFCLLSHLGGYRFYLQAQLDSSQDLTTCQVRGEENYSLFLGAHEIVQAMVPKKNKSRKKKPSSKSEVFDSKEDEKIYRMVLRSCFFALGQMVRAKIMDFEKAMNLYEVGRYYCDKVDSCRPKSQVSKTICARAEGNIAMTTLALQHKLPGLSLMYIERTLDAFSLFKKHSKNPTDGIQYLSRYSLTLTKLFFLDEALPLLVCDDTLSQIFLQSEKIMALYRGYRADNYLTVSGIIDVMQCMTVFFGRQEGYQHYRLACVSWANEVLEDYSKLSPALINLDEVKKYAELNNVREVGEEKTTLEKEAELVINGVKTAKEAFFSALYLRLCKHGYDYTVLLDEKEHILGATIPIKLPERTIDSQILFGARGFCLCIDEAYMPWLKKTIKNKRLEFHLDKDMLYVKDFYRCTLDDYVAICLGLFGEVKRQESERVKVQAEEVRQQVVRTERAQRRQEALAKEQAEQRQRAEEKSRKQEAEIAQKQAEQQRAEQQAKQERKDYLMSLSISERAMLYPDSKEPLVMAAVDAVKDTGWWRSRSLGHCHSIPCFGEPGSSPQKNGVHRPLSSYDVIVAMKELYGNGRKTRNGMTPAQIEDFFKGRSLPVEDEIASSCTKSDADASPVATHMESDAGDEFEVMTPESDSPPPEEHASPDSICAIDVSEWTGTLVDDLRTMQDSIADSAGMSCTVVNDLGDVGLSDEIERDFSLNGSVVIWDAEGAFAEGPCADALLRESVAVRSAEEEHDEFPAEPVSPEAMDLGDLPIRHYWAAYGSSPRLFAYFAQAHEVLCGSESSSDEQEAALIFLKKHCSRYG